MAWMPGRRAASRILEEPYPDVPAHLRYHLEAWVIERLASTPGLDAALAVSLRLPVTAIGSTAIVTRYFKASSDGLLDVVEAWLSSYGKRGSREVKYLDGLLDVANSLYSVREDAAGLEERVSPAVRAAVQHVVDRAAGTPGEHLTQAWNAAYGREADPNKAYNEAKMAVEAAARPIVSPKDNDATLTKMALAIKAKPGKWEFAIPASEDRGVDMVQWMMYRLGKGEVLQHGRPGDAIEGQTIEAARAAVHLAATLVEWCTSGAFAIRA